MLFAGCWVLGILSAEKHSYLLSYLLSPPKQFWNVYLSRRDSCSVTKFSSPPPPIKAWGYHTEILLLMEYALAWPDLKSPPQDFVPGETCSHELQRFLSSGNLVRSASSLCSLPLTDPTALQCVCEHQEKGTRLTSSHPLRPLSYVCPWVCFLWTGLQGRDAMQRTVLALALSAEPMSLSTAVHRDRTVNELRVLHSLSTESQTSFIRETESSLISLR